MIPTTQHSYSVQKEQSSSTPILQNIAYKIIWIFSAIFTLLLLAFQGALWLSKTLLRYSSKILFYAILSLIFITGLLLLCALYVVTFGTLHVP